MRKLSILAASGLACVSITACATGTPSGKATAGGSPTRAPSYFVMSHLATDWQSHVQSNVDNGGSYPGKVKPAYSIRSSGNTAVSIATIHFDDGSMGGGFDQKATATVTIASDGQSWIAQ
jgi:hypothetical protein